MIHLIEKGFHAKYQSIIDAFEGLEYPYQSVHIVPFTQDIIHESFDTKDVFCWGTVKMAHIAKKYGWSPGSMHNDNHDYRIYAPHYGTHMLNHDSQIIKFSDTFKEPGYLFFARPCEDNKAFTGQVFTKESWDEYVEWALNNVHTGALNADTPVQICSRKDIFREVRFFVVDGKIISASQYMINMRVITERTNIHAELELFTFAQEMIDTYQPADAFVIDIAITNEGFKVVEINCINCSGHYDCDTVAIVYAVHEYFSK